MSKSRSLRIVTWNMAYWSHRKRHEDAWRWVLETLGADILLCQECVPPQWVANEWNVCWSQAYPGGRQPWGTGVVSRLPLERAELNPLAAWFENVPSRLPGSDELCGIHKFETWFTPAKIELPGLGCTLVGSLHSPAYPIERVRLQGIDVEGMKLKHSPDVWMTDVVFFHLRPLLGSRMLIGGDFNASRLLDKPSGAGGNNEFFDRIADEGFVSLHRRFHPEDQQTFFKKGRRPHQLDYLYADDVLAREALSCDVHDYDEVCEFSDHAPVVLDIACQA
jgi:hypothetical protein